MKVKLTLNKVFELDLPEDGDNYDPLITELQNMGVTTASPSDIKDAIAEMLNDDVPSLVELGDLNAGDFTIEVPSDATLEVPPAEPEDDSDES